MALNSAPFNVIIEFNLINDNMFSLLLDPAAGSVNYTTQFFEGQNYPGFSGTIPVSLFDQLEILDDDSGLNNLTGVTISFVGSMCMVFFYDQSCAIGWLYFCVQISPKTMPCLCNVMES